jgi:uncharacterized membrane protein
VDWGTFVVQWLHVLLGVAWLGGVLYLNFVTIPTISTLPFGEQQRQLLGRLGAVNIRYFLPISIAVVVLGILRGTVFGPIKGMDDLFATAYGLTWLVALLVTIATFMLGLGVGKRSEAFGRNDELWRPDAEGRPRAAFVKEVAFLKRAGMLEFVGFAIIFTCMILMRFGL